MKNPSTNRSILTLGLLGLFAGALYTSRAFASAAPQQTPTTIDMGAAINSLYEEADEHHGLRFDVVEDKGGSKLTCLLSNYFPSDTHGIADPLMIESAVVVVDMLGVTQRFSMRRLGATWLTQVPRALVFAVTAKDIRLEARCKSATASNVLWTAGATLSF